MLTINQLAIQSSAPAHAVHYYVRIGLIQPAGQKENGYRLFTQQDVGRIRLVRMAKHFGFTRNEIQWFQDDMGGTVPIWCLQFITYLAKSCQ